MANSTCSVVDANYLRSTSAEALFEKAGKSGCIKVTGGPNSTIFKAFNSVGSSRISFEMGGEDTSINCDRKDTVETCLSYNLVDNLSEKGKEISDYPHEALSQNKKFFACGIAGPGFDLCPIFNWTCTNAVPVDENEYCKKASWFCDDNKPQELSVKVCQDLYKQS